MRTERTRRLLDADEAAADECSDEDDDTDDDDLADRMSWLDRVVRIASPSRMLTRGEVAGALGDLGTFLPDVVALSKNAAAPLADPAAMVFFSGVWSVWAGLVFDMPMPIQPMHAVVAIALTEGLTYPQMIASSLWLGGAFFLLGALGLISWCERVIPLAVVRGLQLGLGLKVFSTGASLALKSIPAGEPWASSGSDMGEVALLVVAAGLALALYGDRHWPAALVLFALGLCRKHRHGSRHPALAVALVPLLRRLSHRLLSASSHPEQVPSLPDPSSTSAATCRSHHCRSVSSGAPTRGRRSFGRRCRSCRSRC